MLSHTHTGIPSHVFSQSFPTKISIAHFVRPTRLKKWGEVRIMKAPRCVIFYSATSFILGPNTLLKTPKSLMFPRT